VIAGTARASSVSSLGAAACLALALGIILRNPIQINHDAAACLVAGAQMLAGQRLYVDIVDTNPPLIYYLHVPPAAIARTLGAPLVLTFMLVVWSLTVLSTIATVRFCRKAFGPADATPGLIGLSVAATAAALLHTNDYGQREQLFMLAWLPYLALRSCRMAETQIPLAPAVLIGIAAGIAACIKPHFVAIWLAVEIFLFVVGRSRRVSLTPEVLAVVSVGVAYAAHFLLLPAQIREAWFGRWLPFVVRGYRAYEQPIAWLAVERVVIWLPAVMSVALFADVRRGPSQVFAKTLVITAIGGVLSFAAQRKDWIYQAIPAVSATVAIAAWLAGQLVQRAGGRLGQPALERARAAAAIVLAVALAGALVDAALHARTPAHALAQAADTEEIAHAFAANSRPGDAVLAIATSVAIAYPSMAQFERRPGSRYVFSFPLPMLYEGAAARGSSPFPYDLPAGWRRDEEVRFREELRDDIAQRQPSMILVGTPASCQACPPGFTLDGYLAQTGFLRDAMSGYRHLETGTWASVYVRR
jgi:hypothetical protein